MPWYSKVGLQISCRKSEKIIAGAVNDTKLFSEELPAEDVRVHCSLQFGRWPVNSTGSGHQINKQLGPARESRWQD